MLGQADKIHRAIGRGLELRQKALEVDVTIVKLRIEVLLDRHTHAPKKVLYQTFGEDDLIER